MKHQDLWAHYFPEFIKNNDATIRSLMTAAQLVHLPAGQHIFYPGSPCENYLLLLEGHVKIYIIATNGREMVLYHVHSGDSCVLTTSCLLGKNYYPAAGITETEVSALMISSHAFQRCVEQSTFFREFVFKSFSSRLSHIITRMEEVVFESIDVRLSKLLLAAAENPFKITHHQLAVELGSAREVISRHLKCFEDYGWLTLNRGTINIINRHALAAIQTSNL